MTASAKTLRALERAAAFNSKRLDKWIMEHSDWLGAGPDASLRVIASHLALACARHAAALKRKRTGRR